jgi:aspartyl-tRNA(Asn)/glutamyl-tRNA(Gln) amidotransferase subunit A
MTDDELTGLTIAGAGRLLRTRALSPVELTEACLARIGRLDPVLRAFITVTGDLARRQARRAEREIARGRWRGPLHGIPVTLKDLYWTAGIRTTGGSRILADFVPSANATATERLHGAGAVLLGKTNLHEFAAGVTTDNPHWGTCQNPWKLGYIPGGSSGGSGAAVAASLGLASLGSDTGGSIRIPAAFCGIVGHKPTYGLVPRHGILPESWSLDHGGPMTRTAADAAIVLQAIAGHDPRDPTSSPRPVPAFARALRADLRGVRLGVPRNYYFDVVDPEVERAVRRAIATLGALGARVVDVRVPGVEAALDTCFVVAWAEAAHYHRRWLSTRAAEYGPDVRALLEGALLYLASDYLQGQQVRALIRRSLAEVFRRVDVLVSPTAPLAATPIGRLETVIRGRRVSVLDVAARLTCVANLTGEPACSVPCGFTRAGLPVGLMIHGRAFEDATVLRVAHAYEQAAGPTARPVLETGGDRPGNRRLSAHGDERHIGHRAPAARRAP